MTIGARHGRHPAPEPIPRSPLRARSCPAPRLRVTRTFQCASADRTVSRETWKRRSRIGAAIEHNDLLSVCIARISANASVGSLIRLAGSLGSARPSEGGRGPLRNSHCCAIGLWRSGSCRPWQKLRGPRHRREVARRQRRVHRGPD
jgi:hypothetical protein